METTKSQILLVDDSPSDLQLMVECLRDEFMVAVAKDGARAVEMCTDSSLAPKVVLMDVSMPDLDGYQACERIKSNPDSAHTEIIFISANTGLDEKLKGYDVGGSDYITKPIEPAEMVRKVKLAIARDEARLQAEEQQQAAMETAMTAIMDAGEQAGIIHFMRESFICDSVQSLADLIVSACTGFGLTTSVQIRTPFSVINSGTNGAIPPLEAELLTKFQSIGRIHQRGRRLFLNFGDISQLIKNMPTEDENKSGRLRDHLALVLEGALSRLDMLIIQEELKNLLKETNESLDQLSSTQSEQKKKNISIMDNMLEEIQAGFFMYGGLTEEQEKMLLAIVEKYSDQIFRVYEEGMQTDSQLRHIAERISRAANKPQPLRSTSQSGEL